MDLSLLQNSWMKSGKNKPKWNYLEKRVRQSAKDLLYKKMFPPYAQKYLTDESMIQSAIEEVFRGPYTQWTCHKCGIGVFGPKKWIHFHLAIHGKFQNRERRGNEVYEMKFGLG